MATSADKDDDRDDDDDKDEAEESEEGEEKSAAPKAADKKAASAKSAAAKSDDDDDDDEDDDDEDEDEDDEDDEPPAKPAAKAAAKPAAKSSAKPAAKSAPVTAKRGPATAARTTRARPVPAKQGGALGKSMILFIIIIGGVAAAFALLGREDTAPPKWKVGESVDLEITLVSTDRTDLSCAAADEVAGKHCGFEGQNKPWSKGDNADDQKLLKPYTTVNGVQLLGAGMWSDAGMTATPLPPVARFSAKCKYKVEGTIKKASVRWKNDGPWFDRADDLYAGSFSSCKVLAPSNQ